MENTSKNMSISVDIGSHESEVTVGIPFERDPITGIFRIGDPIIMKSETPMEGVHKKGTE